MATSSFFPPAVPEASLDGLSSELIALILEQLRDMHPPSLVSVRCVSRRFDAMATPIAYHSFALNERVTAHGAEHKYALAFRRMSLLTRHVSIKSDLRPEGIRRIVDLLSKLESIRWQCVDDKFHSGPFWMPSDVLSPQHPRFSKIQIHVENLPLRSFEREQYNVYLRAIPARRLVSLKLGTPTPPLATRLQSLKNLLLVARDLETFHYHDRGQGTHFEFEEGERLPAFKDVSLKSYDWDHDGDEVREHWDFSRIRSLELVTVPVFNFLASISFPDLARLRHLRVEDFSAHQPLDRRKDATRGLHVLVRDHVLALRSLDLTCHTYHFPIDALLQHAATLETLRLRDHVGFADDDRPCPTMRTHDLESLSRGLVVLRSLEMDMYAASTDPPLFLRALASFPRLQTLVLNVQTVLHADEVVPTELDRDLDVAMTYFETLMRLRGAAAVPWRSITVNVGGWQPVMIRRLGEAWRRQNQRGVFAERCFVLERSVPGGGYLVREEKSVEPFQFDSGMDDLDAE